MALRNAVPFVLLLTVGVAGVIVLVLVALDRIPNQPIGLFTALAFAIFVGAVVLLVGWVLAAFLLEIITNSHMDAAAAIVLTIFGTASAVVTVRLFSVEPKLRTALKDRTELKSYVASHWKYVVLQHITAWIAIYGTALLVFGWGPLGDFLSGKVQHALSLLGL